MKGLIIFSTVTFVAVKTASAAVLGLFNPYIGASYSILNGNVSVKNNANIPLSTSNKTGNAFGAHLGFDSNLIIMKLGVEAFYEKATNFTSTSGIAPAQITFKNPSSYGLKARAGFSFFVADIYGTLGVARSEYDVSGMSSQTYTMGIAGVGIAAKLPFIPLGLYAEYAYWVPLKKQNSANLIDIKPTRSAIQIGARYYFL